jgi:hypothetical protein
MTTKGKRYLAEVREQAVRLVMEYRRDYESEWWPTSRGQQRGGAADQGARAGEQAAAPCDEILKPASAFFARELGPQPRR